MATDLERLTVHFEAQTAKFEKALDRIERKTLASSKRVEKQAAAMEAALSARAAGALAAINGLSGALGGGTLLAGLGLTAVIGQLRQVASEFAAIADTADRTGLGAEKIQELGYAAEMAGGSTQEMSSGLVKFSKNVSEAARGAGDLAKIFEANNVAMAKSDGTLKSTSELLDEYADLVMNAKNPQDALNLATMAFGKSAGPALIVALKDGREGLRKAADEARRFGAVASADVVARAAEIDDAFVRLALVIKTQFGSALVESVGAIQTYQNAILGLGVAIGAVVGGLTLGPLVAGLTAAAAQAVVAARAMSALGAAASVASLATSGLAAVITRFGPAGLVIGALIAAVGYLAIRQDDAKVAAETHKAALDEMDAAIAKVAAKVPGAEAALKKLGDAHIEAAKKALANAQAQYEVSKAAAEAAQRGATGAQRSGWRQNQNMDRGGVLAANAEADLKRVQDAQAKIAELEKKLDSGLNPAPKTGGATKLPSTDTGGDNKDAYDRELKQIRERTSLLEVEAQTVGKGAYEIDKARVAQELLNAAKEAGRAITPELLAQINAEAEAHARATQKVEQAQEAYRAFEEVRDGLSGAFSGMVSAVRQGDDAIKSLTDSLGRLMDQVLDMIAKQLFKQLFAGFTFSDGGFALAGGGNAVRAAGGGSIRGAGTGTSDSIPAWLSNGEYVVNAKMAKKYGAFLDAINSGRFHLPAFATGGSVGAPVARSSGMGGNMVVNIQNNGAAVETRQRRQGGSQILDVIVEQKVNQMIATGRTDQSNMARFGTSPRKVVRG